MRLEAIKRRASERAPRDDAQVYHDRRELIAEVERLHEEAEHIAERNNELESIVAAIQPGTSSAIIRELIAFAESECDRDPVGSEPVMDAVKREFSRLRKDFSEVCQSADRLIAEQKAIREEVERLRELLKKCKPHLIGNGHPESVKLFFRVQDEIGDDE